MRNRNDANPIGHDNVLALANDAESGFLESLDRIEMIYARDSWHN